ncbi:MAG: class I SAM-dependent methyltransferase [Candidatus Paceibacterota bacterium]|jgi:2-polyprenyl-3-methyl-5-hydroxy-6-metoxy-1,4-benzoquinol methylase
MKNSKNINEKECFVCSSSSIPKIIGQYKHWKLYECPNCFFQYWWPIEQALDQYFEEKYKSFADTKTKPDFGMNQKLALKFVKSEVKKQINLNNLLDVGCGEGAFLNGIRDSGISSWGVDFNSRAIKKAKKIFGLKNLYPLSIYDFAKTSKLPKFDIITFFEVLEHIGDPLKFIRTIKKLLINSGIIIFSVPDAKTYGYWEKIINVPPHHLTRWTKDIIRQLLNQYGFEVLKIKSINRPDSECSFMNLSLKMGAKKNHYASFSTKTKMIWKYLSLPYRQIIYLLKLKRPTIFVIAQLK